MPEISLSSGPAHLWDEPDSSWQRACFPGLRDLDYPERDELPRLVVRGPEHARQINKRAMKAIAGCGIRTAAGIVLSLSSMAAVTFTALSYLAQGGSTFLVPITLGALLGTALESAAVYLLNRWAADQEGSGGWCFGYEKRLQDSVRRISAKMNIREPRTYLIDAIPAGMLDNTISKDLLLMKPDFINRLTDRELDSIVAHELNHSNHWTSPLRFVERNLGRFSGWAALFGIASAVLTLCPAVNFFSFCLCIPVILYLRRLVGYVPLIFSTWGSRNNEMRTDIRAVAVTKDPDALISALYKAQENVMNEARGKKLPPPWRRSHPSMEQRARRLREIFS